MNILFRSRNPVTRILFRMNPLRQDGKPNIDPRKGKWIGSRRELASVLGRIMWHRRVHDIHFANEEHRDVSKAVREIFQLLTPPADEGWNSSIHLSPVHTRHLCSAWRLRHSQAPSKALPILKSLNKIVRVAVDAATNEDVRPHLFSQAVVVEVDLSSHQPFRVFGGSYDDSSCNKHIALGELFAIWLAVDYYADKCDLLVLASDSTTATH